MPLISLPRGFRVVQETEYPISENSANNLLHSVDLPAPEGADTTISIGRFVRMLFNILDLFSDAFQFGFEFDDISRNTGVIGF